MRPFFVHAVLNITSEFGGCRRAPRRCVYALLPALIALGCAIGVPRVEGVDRDDEQSSEEAPIVTTLPEETVQKAREICPEILQMRVEVDRLWKEYERLALTLGEDRRRDALRDISRVKRDLERALEDLKEEYEEAVEPVVEDREELEEDEEEIFERIDRLVNRGKDAEEERREADDLNRKKQVLEEKKTVLDAVGNPSLKVEEPQDMLLGVLIKPDRQQQSGLAHIVEEYPDLVEGRIYIANVDAEIAELEKGDANEDRRHAERRVEKLRKRRENALEKYRDVFLDIREEYAEEYHDLLDDRDRLMPRVERDRERGRSGRNEQKLSVLEKQIEGLRRRIGVLDQFVKGTGAVSDDELKQMLAREKPDEDD